MNVPLGDRIEQMRLGLERYRWLSYQFKQPPIMINVPEFRLYGFDEEGKVALTMRVNVGEDYNHQTPMFEDNIQYMIFRPYCPLRQTSCAGRSFPIWKRLLL